jgi:hypothetical protein
MTYKIVAYPEGKGTVIATLRGLDRWASEVLIERAAALAGLTNAGSEAQGIVTHATNIAKVNGEYVDVMRIHDDYSQPIEHVATVGPEGPVA